MQGSTLAAILLAEDACYDGNCYTRLGCFLTDAVIGLDIVEIPILMSNRLVYSAIIGRGVAQRVALNFYI